jgi:hypothetical protein
MVKVLSVSEDYVVKVPSQGTLTLNTGDRVGEVIITGNLTVFGVTNTVSDLVTVDTIIELNSGEVGQGISTNISGIQINRGSLPDAKLLFNESLDRVNASDKGAFELVNEDGETLSLYAKKISNKDGNDLILVGSGSASVTVQGTENYEQQIFSYNNLGLDSSGLFSPLKPSALVTAQLLADYINTYDDNQSVDSKIVSPRPNGDTTVQVQSVAAGDSFDRAVVTIDSYLAVQIDQTTSNFYTDLTVDSDYSIVNSNFVNGTISNSQIALRNTADAGEIPTTEDVVNGELFVNLQDERIYFKTAKSRIREVGLADRVANVFYVSNDSGDDSNNGTTLSDPFKTIDAALEWINQIRAGQPEEEFREITIFVKSGNYTLNNPVTVPERVGIVGDSLRTVTVRPTNRTQDMFWVMNGSYLTHMTFKDHLAPASAVAFPIDGSAGFIIQSPYVQNCTSITTTGTGMRVDGNHAKGLKSMVVDAYTQYNQGGIGIHMLNRGNTQLVSVFTICCDVAFLCESGGFCSITNSNSSFGNYALKADGVSDILYSARLKNQISTNQFEINGLIKKPNVGDAVKFSSLNSYYTVSSVGELFVNEYDIDPPNYSLTSLDFQTERNTLLATKSFIQTETIKFLAREYPGFTYDDAKCSRDVGIIIESVVDDALFNSNYRSSKAARSYYRAMAAEVIQNQKIETVAALAFARDLLLSFANSSLEIKTRIQTNFNMIIDVIENGEEQIPALIYTIPVDIPASQSNATSILQANKNFLVQKGTAYVNANYPELTYNQATCQRDIGLILDSMVYDLLYGGNSQTIDSVKTYFNSGTLQIPENQLQPSAAMFDYLRTIAKQVVVNQAVSDAYDVTEQQNLTAASAASQTEQDILEELFTIAETFLTDGYRTILTIEEEIAQDNVIINEVITFHQLSLITSSGHTFEWVGAGTDVNTALPYLGGIPIEANQVVQNNGGRVYFTGTDQKGDFSIGTDLKINRARGTVEGRVFRKSLYSTLTPYILALGEG